MRLIFLSAIITACSVACVSSPAHEKEQGSLTENEVREFVRQYDDMWINRDTSNMKNAMDEQYIYFTSIGGTINRGDIIKWFTPADKYKIEKSNRSEISVQLKGNTAIVSSRWKGNGSFGEEKFNDDQRCGLVIQKIDGKLKLIAEHCTQIATPPVLVQ